MKIEYWSDYACPYCYIGETNLRHALEELDIMYTMEMKAFELDPYAKKGAGGDVVAMFAAKYRLDLNEAQAKVDSINAMAAQAGIEFDYSKVFHTNTFDAHRLTKYALSKGDLELHNRMSERLYKAYFGDHVDVGDHDVLVAIADELGLDHDETVKVLSSKEYSDEVSLDERSARSNRVSSVPCFLINDKSAIPGAMPKEQFIEVIKKYFPEEIPMAI